MFLKQQATTVYSHHTSDTPTAQALFYRGLVKRINVSLKVLKCYVIVLVWEDIRFYVGMVYPQRRCTLYSLQ